VTSAVCPARAGSCANQRGLHDLRRRGRISHDLDGDGDEPCAYAEIGKIELVLEGTEPNSWDTPRA
jgi:hypothetical protein